MGKPEPRCTCGPGFLVPTPACCCSTAAVAGAQPVSPILSVPAPCAMPLSITAETVVRQLRLGTCSRTGSVASEVSPLAVTRSLPSRRVDWEGRAQSHSWESDLRGEDSREIRDSVHLATRSR